MNTQNIFYLFLWCIINSSTLYAQNNKGVSGPLVEKMEHYSLKQSASTLFTCFDKNVYVANENVWFTTYVLNYAVKTPKPTILSVILVDDSCRSILLEQKCEIADGLAFGHLIIPDSIPPGDYSFITYTNVLTNGAPSDIFIQPITIKETQGQAFFVSLKLDTAEERFGGYQKVMLKMENLAHQPIAGATASWIIGDMQDKKFWGVVKTDKDGKYIFSIPRNQIIKGKNVLNVSAIFLNDVRNIRLALPTEAGKLNVRFFPEGGNLVDGMESTVGWEAKFADGSPQKTTAVLYKNGQTFDTVETDRYGMGKFNFTPAAQSKYTVKIIGDADSSYVLPRILPAGAVLNLKKAILNDSLLIKLSSKYRQTYMVVVHNFRQVFYSFPIETNPAGKLIDVNLQDIPKGLCTITVLDSLERPCAERLFFAHYNPRSAVSIITNEQEYTTRKKVKIKLQLNSTHSDSAKAIVTVACVQSSRIGLKKVNDIASYIYLKNELETLPAKENYMGQSGADKAYLEEVLLIKGWRRYKWQEMAIENADTGTEKKIAINMIGAITKYGKAIKKPANVMIMTDSATNLIKTDAGGDFELTVNNILVQENKKAHLLLQQNTNEGYQIKMRDVFSDVNRRIVNNFTPVNYNLQPGYLTSNDTGIFKNLNHIIKLKEVKILGEKDDIFAQSPPTSIRAAALANECGDYVCPYNILNCPHHFGYIYNSLPVTGQIYLQPGGFGHVTYYGCKIIKNKTELEMTSFNGINYPAEFYGPDYAKFNPPDREDETTIYWKHACYLDSKKETELSFYTSDITGLFDVIVQGVSSDDLIYQKIEFNVKKQ